jgi:hypothetical protein
MVFQWRGCHGNAYEDFLESGMKKEKLVEKISTILKTDVDLSYLSVLKQEELEKLIACIRYRIDQKD